jgi:hypothetical protein
MGLVRVIISSPSLTAAAQITRAGSTTDLAIGLCLALLGCILGLDVKELSSILHKNTSRALREGKPEYDPWRGRNPFRLAGWGFLGIGIIILVTGAVGLILPNV